MRFTLIPSHWFGLTMFPGYVDCPYHSPIRVDAIESLGNRMFQLRFLNLGYAAGVQDFSKRLRTLRRTQTHLVAEETEVEDRTYVLVSLNPAWLRRHFPELNSEEFFDVQGMPRDVQLLRLAAAAF